MSNILISVLVDVNRKLGLRHLGSKLTDIVCRKPNVNRTSYFLGLRRSKVNVGARESAGFIVLSGYLNLSHVVLWSSCVNHSSFI